MLTFLKHNIQTRRGYLAPVFLLCAISFIFIHSAYAAHKTVSVAGPSNNLISGQDWSHFAGATQNDNSVHIDPLGRAIVNQDGSGGQPNPPVNVRGPHLTVKGNFEIDATFANIPANGPA